MQHANTIDLSKSLFIRVLYAMARTTIAQVPQP